MKEIPKLFDTINKAKISQRDEFILLLTLSSLVQSFGILILAKQLPDLVEWILKLLGVLYILLHGQVDQIERAWKIPGSFYLVRLEQHITNLESWGQT